MTQRTTDAVHEIRIKRQKKPYREQDKERKRQSNCKSHDERWKRAMQTESSAERWAKGERVGRKQRKKDSRDGEKTEEDKVREMCTNKVETSEWVSEYVRRRERKRERWRGEVLVVSLPQELPGKRQLGLLANLSLLYCENNSLCLYTHSRTHIGNIALILHYACWKTSSNSGKFVCYIYNPQVLYQSQRKPC